MRTPTPDHIEGFFAGMEHARRKAAEVNRGKEKAIEREIVTLRLCQFAKAARAAVPVVTNAAGVLGFFIIFTMPCWAPWVFYAMTGKPMQF